MSWFGWFGTKPAETVLPLSGPPSPSGGHPLTEVVVKKNTPPITTGATAPPMPPSTIGANALKAGIPPPPIAQTPRRGDYVALGGSRKSGKARKGKKSRKSKSKKSKKASKFRK